MVFLGWGDRDLSLGEWIGQGIPGDIANGFVAAFCDIVTREPPYPFNYLFDTPDGFPLGSVGAGIAATVQRACRFAAVNPVRTLSGTTQYTVPGLCEIRGLVVLQDLATNTEFTLGINLGDCADPIPGNKPGLPQGPPFISESLDGGDTVELYLPCQRPGENGYFQSLSGPIDPTVARIVGVRDFEVTPCDPVEVGEEAKYPVIIVEPGQPQPPDLSIPVEFDLNLNPQLSIPMLIPFTLVRPQVQFDVTPTLRFEPRLNGQLRLDLAPTIELDLGGLTIGGGSSVTTGDLVEIGEGVDVECPECDCPTPEEISSELLKNFEKQVLRPRSRTVQTVAVGTLGGTFNLPLGTVAVAVENVTLTGQMRSQAGSGTAPAVYYAGWYSFGSQLNRPGIRTPLSFRNQTITAPLQSYAFSITLNWGARADVFAIVETEYD